MFLFTFAYFLSLYYYLWFFLFIYLFSFLVVFCFNIIFIFRVDFVVKLLREEQFHAAGLHSDKTQPYRFRVMKAFKDGTFSFSLSTSLFPFWLFVLSFCVFGCKTHPYRTVSSLWKHYFLISLSASLCIFVFHLSALYFFNFFIILF